MMAGLEMSRSATQRTSTPFGEVEYETVVCSSCDNEVAKEEAKRFVIGSVEDVKNWSFRNRREYEFDLYDYQEGWACPYCRDEGVIRFPTRTWSYKKLKLVLLLAGLSGVFVGLLGGMPL